EPGVEGAAAEPPGPYLLAPRVDAVEDPLHLGGGREWAHEHALREEASAACDGPDVLPRDGRVDRPARAGRPHDGGASLGGDSESPHAVARRLDERLTEDVQRGVQEGLRVVLDEAGPRAGRQQLAVR